MTSKTKKTDWTNLSRRIIQIVSFILMPGLFISTLSSIKIVYTALLQGTFNATTLAPQLLILLAVIPVTIIFGRIFCGFICSFGALGDFVWFVSKKIRKKKTKISPKADKVLKSFKYILLIFLIVFVWTLGALTIDASYNPWNVFGMYSALSAWSNLAGFLTIGGALLILILVGSFFIERFFCRYMCPLGAGLSVLSRFRLLKIKKPSDVCKSCKACTNSCSMGIDMYKHEEIKSGECIDCFNCIKPCPRENSHLSFLGKKVTPILTGLATCVVIALLVLVGKVATNYAYATPNDNTQMIETGISEEPIQLGPYEDGVYSAEARGYRGYTTVSVTVVNGYIINIEVISTDDDMEFFILAQDYVVSEMFKEQSTEVDTLSGATYSSKAIIDAVNNAVVLREGSNSSEMKIEETALITPTLSPTASQTPEPTIEIPGISNEDLLNIEDGVYIGSGSGFRGETEVEVTIQDGAIVDVIITDYLDDRPYVEHSLSIIDEIVNNQTIDVDTVSGATFTSNSIIEAVANALGIDFENPNSESESNHEGRRGRGQERDG